MTENTAKAGPRWGGGSRVTMRTTAICPNDTLTRVTARNFEIVIDEPPSNHGENLGPQPLEYLLASLAGCTNVIVHKICNDRGYSLFDMEVDVTGSLDTRGIFGDENIPVPFPEVQLTIRGKTRSTPAEIEQLKEELAWRCPVSVILRQSGTVINEIWSVTHV